MSLTHDFNLVFNTMKDYLLGHPELALEEAWYGDQAKVPATPSVGIEPGKTRLQAYGTGRQYKVLFIGLVTVYYQQIIDEESLKDESDKFTMQVANALFQNKTLNGLIIYGAVTEIEPGIARMRAGPRFRASRLLWEGESRKVL